MSKAKTNTVTLVLASLGCLVTLILFYKHLRPDADVGCTVFRSDCGRVIESAFGHVGPIPTSLFGMAMYLSVIGLCLKRRKLLTANPIDSAPAADPVATVSEEEKEQALSELGITTPTSFPVTAPTLSLPAPGNAELKKLNLALWLIALSAFGISWWLQFVALFQIFSMCPWCFSSACLVTAIFGITSYDFLFRDMKLVGEQKLMAGTIAFIGAMGLLMGLPYVINQINIISSQTPAAPHQPPPNSHIRMLRSPDMEITGNPNSPITIVEFADYQCEHCQKAAFLLAQYMKTNPNRFRFAFRNYPLPMHAWARTAALAAEAAGEQHKFWEMHDYIFQHQSDMDKKGFNPEYFDQYAAELGLDVKKFDADMQNDKISNRIVNDAAVAQGLVTMTPTFFIFNGDSNPWMVTGQGDMSDVLKDPTNKVWQPKSKQ